jgi:hypothetical protein
MASKKSFVLRIDDDTFATLEKWAADEFRSVNGQIEWILTKAIREAGRKPKAGKSPPPVAEDSPERPTNSD